MHVDPSYYLCAFPRNLLGRLIFVPFTRLEFWILRGSRFNMSHKFSPSLIRLLALLSAFTALTCAGAFAQPESVIYNFSGTADGAYPASQLIADKAGNIYGTTTGPTYGTVFELVHDGGGEYFKNTLHNFSGPDGSGPVGGLVMDAKGNLYGTTYYGGTYNEGVVYELQAVTTGGWNFAVIHNFNYDGVNNFDGVWPSASLVLDGKGNLYGTTQQGGTGLCNEATDSSIHPTSVPKGQTYYSCGTVFEVSPQANGTWSERVIHSFQDTDGGLPSASLTFDKAGNLYGTTASGGYYGNLCVGVWVSGCGAVFQLARNGNGTWTESILYFFSSNQNGSQDSAEPFGGVHFDSEGNLYGANQGVFQEGGAMFKLSPSSSGSWTETTLYNLDDESAGFGELGNLLMDGAGNLYGTTEYGSGPVTTTSHARSDSSVPPKPFGPGTVYKLSPGASGTWTVTWLHTFGTGFDGIGPAAGLLRLGNVLYGTTLDGGTWGYGVVFRLVP
jgi:uncharacterized repeat protein (TIGR03803 family)